MKHLSYVFKGSLQANLAYRTWMITSSLTNLIYIVIVYYLWQAIYAQSETLNGMTFEASFLYLTWTSTFFAVFKSFVDYEMAFAIQQGQIINYLLKPIEHRHYMLADNIGRIVITLLFVVMPATLLIQYLVGMQVRLSWTTLLFIPAFLIAYKISFLIDYMVGCVAFYTESIWGIFTTKDMLIMALSGVAIPLVFFPQWLQGGLIWSPFIAIYHTPVSMLLGENTAVQAMQGMVNQLLWLLFFYLAARAFFTVSIRKLSINGG